VALIGFFPKHGHVLMCDFSTGFVLPEMVKNRPVVVISREDTHGRKLCTVVPLSTTTPFPIHPWHVLIQSNPLGEQGAATTVWAKCDMLYTVSFARLDKPHRKKQGKREYFAPKLLVTEIKAVRDGVAAYLRLTDKQ
jgi:uncharacterized protein YifN (PemK superfamily)